MAEVTHALLSPSASHRWLTCPGSVQANTDKPWEQNAHALLGTTAHGLLEVCIRLATDPADYLGQVLEPGHMPIEEEMVDTVGYALDYVRAYVAANPKAHVHAEHKVIIGPQIGTDEETCFGFSDLVLDNYPKEVVILDYKHGVGIPVSVKENSQLRLYAAGMRHKRGRYQRYRSVVVQPRVRGRKPVQEATQTDAQLAQWLKGTVIPVVPVALAGDAPRVAGEHCRYCAANGKCSAQFELVQNAAKEEFMKNDPKALSPAQYAAALDTLATLNIIGEAIRAQAVLLVHGGKKIPGYEKAWTAARRMWSDSLPEPKLVKKLAALGLEGPAAYAPPAVLSPAQAEKALRAAGKWPRKARGEEAPKSPLEPLVDYTEQNPTIAKV